MIRTFEDNEELSSPTATNLASHVSREKTRFSRFTQHMSLHISLLTLLITLDALYAKQTELSLSFEAFLS